MDAGNSDDLAIHGYHICSGCGGWTTDKTCAVCREKRGKAAAVRVDVEIAGHLVSVGTRKRQIRRGSYRNTQRGANVVKARHRAEARLVACYRDLFDAMVAEELAKLGERPIRTRTDVVRRLNRIALDSMTLDQRSA